MENKIKVCFFCHGNFCRSPMAELLFQDMVNQAHLADHFVIDSRAATSEDVGSPPHPEATRVLREHGLSTAGKYAVQLTPKDYDYYDYLIGMDHINLREIRRVIRSDPEGKISLLLDYTDHPRDIADPWLTHNFEKTYEDIMTGLTAFLKYLM